jgi:hypothetical protein
MPTYLVTGRRLTDYAATGTALPDDCVISPCLGCGQPVAISQEGAAKLVEWKSKQPAGVICTPCLLLVTPSMPIRGVEMTKAGANQLERSDRAKEIVSRLLTRMDETAGDP